MARISKYKFDEDVTKDDFVIGTDSLTKATKNFKLADVIQLFYDDKGIIDRLEEIESQFILTNGEITQLNTNEVIFQQSDRRADFQFTTSSFAPSQEVLGNESLWYFDFNHNLNKYPSIMVTESGSPDQFCMVPVKYINTNTVRVYFKSKTSGKVHAN